METKKFSVKILSSVVVENDKGKSILCTIETTNEKGTFIKNVYLNGYDVQKIDYEHYKYKNSK